MGTGLRIIEIVAGIGLLIFVHELGHFLAAKWAGIRVEKFALGFGPKVLWHKRGETEYSIRAIPLGGFVAMAGEEPGSEASPSPEREFRNRPVGKRAVVIMAGVVMNFITSVILFAIILCAGLRRPQPVVGAVLPDSPAAQAGMRSGDRIVAINGSPVRGFMDVMLSILKTSAGEALSLTIERDGARKILSVTAETDPNLGMPAIGIGVAMGRIITKVEKDTPAGAAGLRENDVIRSVDGKVFYAEDDFQLYLGTRIGKVVNFAVERDGETLDIQLTPGTVQGGTLGITPKERPRVKEVEKDQPADKAGILAGDRVTAVDGRPVHIIRDIMHATARSAGRPLEYTVLRDGRTLPISVTPKVFPGENRGRIGLHFDTQKDFTVGAVEKGSPAEQAGIQPGDVLTHIDGKTFEKYSWSRLRLYLLDKGGKEVTVAWRSGEAPFEKTVTVAEAPCPGEPEHGIWLEPTLTYVRKHTLLEAPWEGLKESWMALEQVYVAVRGMITRRIVAKKAIGGPVGILSISYKAAEAGLKQFIYLVAFIGVNLAAVNLIPLLPLDGGMLLFLLIEKFRGKPVNERWQIRFQIAGWVLILTLFAVITVNDIARLVG